MRQGVSGNNRSSTTWVGCTGGDDPKRGIINKEIYIKKKKNELFLIVMCLVMITVNPYLQIKNVSVQFDSHKEFSAQIIFEWFHTESEAIFPKIHLVGKEGFFPVRSLKMGFLVPMFGSPYNH